MEGKLAKFVFASEEDKEVRKDVSTEVNLVLFVKSLKVDTLLWLWKEFEKVSLVSEVGRIFSVEKFENLAGEKPSPQNCFTFVKTIGDISHFKT